jgi:hypothetical protein
MSLTDDVLTLQIPRLTYRCNADMVKEYVSFGLRR